MILVAFLLTIIAAVLLILANRQRVETGLPSGRIVYTDTDNWGKVEHAIFDPITGLTGKPDYLVKQNGTLIPVEVKSSWAPAHPYETHIYQVAAYCMLVERTRGVRPPYGILKYRNRSYEIDYTPQIEANLIELISQIRRQSRLGEADRSHEAPARCAGCAYRHICDQQL